MDDTLISRREFIKKLAVGTLGIMALGNIGVIDANAATVNDNLSSDSGIYVGPLEPSKNKLWIDTSNGGVTKYYDASSGTWVLTRSTWNE